MYRASDKTSSGSEMYRICHCLFTDVINTEFTASNAGIVTEYCIGKIMERFTSWSNMR